MQTLRLTNNLEEELDVTDLIPTKDFSRNTLIPNGYADIKVNKSSIKKSSDGKMICLVSVYQPSIYSKWTLELEIDESDYIYSQKYNGNVPIITTMQIKSS